MMPRQVFYGRSRPLVHEPLASLQSKVITLNRSARELLGPIRPDDDDRPMMVELSYDTDTQIIFIQPVNSDELHLYPVRRAKGAGDTWVIASQKFTKHFKISVSGLRRYRVTVEGDGEDRALLINLNEQNSIPRYSRGQADGRASAT